MLLTAIVLALIVGLLEVAFKIRLPDPWRMVVIVGIAVLFVLGLLAVLLPGTTWLGRY